MAMFDKAQSGDEIDPDRRSGAMRAARLIPLFLAAGMMVAALILPSFMLQGERRPDVPGLGPGAWPGAILLGLALFSGIWLATEFWVLARRGGTPSLAAPDDEESYHYGKALIGIGLVIAYGWLMPTLGFALSTALFLLIWCLYGGLRHLLVLTLVPLLGTLILLWVFMGLALMPLSRGTGVFEHFSVWLLKLIGIY
jgi:putative tricarboxylic transport membrane protein